jgi:PAS domain S-box-containing protein
VNRAPFAAWTSASLPRYWGVVAALAAIYLGAAKIGLRLALTAEQITLVWPAAGIALGAVLLFGSRIWPGIAIGAFLANLTTSHETIFTAAGIATGNTLEAIIGAYLLDRFVEFRRSLARFKDVLGLVVFAALISTAVSATIGVASLCIGGVHSWANFGSLWPIWWLGDAVGDVLVAPVLLVLSNVGHLRWRTSRVVEAAGLVVAFVITCLIVFADFWGLWADRGPGLKFLLFPFIIWAAVRYGQLGATLLSLAVSVIALVVATHGVGPIGSNLNDRSLAVLQGFIGVLSVSGLLLSAAMSERDTADRHRAAAHAVTRVLAEATSLEEASERIVRTVCETLQWDAGAVWNLDQESHLLRCVTVWHQPILKIPEFEAVTRRREFMPGQGLPGRIWASGGAAWIPDVVSDTNFPRAPIAAREGLHAAFGFPIRLRDQILGAIEFFSREIQEPDDRLLQLMTSLGGQIGQFIDRKRNDAALRAAQHQLQTITDTMAASVVRCSRDQRYIWVSRNYAEMLGLSTDEIAGRPIAEIMGAAAYASIRPYIDRVLCGERVEYEARVDYKAIGSRWIHAVYVPTYDAVDAPDGWVAVVTDYTQRRELEDASRRLAAIVESSDDAIIGKTLEGLITNWNPAAERLFGYSQSEILGKHVSILAPPERRLEASEIIGRIRRGQHIDQFETQRCRKDGTLIDVSLTVSPIHDAAGHTIGASIIARDITERKRFERELLEGDRRKNEFIGMLAHELRNPLAVITNASEVLERMGSPEPRALKLHSMIMRQAHVLAQIVDDLLDVSRLSRGKIKLDKQPVEVSGIVARAVDAVRLLMQTKQHHMELPTALQSIWIESDPTRLEQILVNLLTNAAKYTDPGGRISLSVERDDGSVMFSVQDTGIGIAPEMMPRIFDLFAQADDSFARTQGGLGIGLFLVQTLVRMHGGTVTVASEGLGKGSMFTVRLPALPDEKTALPLVTEIDHSTGPALRVLVVDDNQEVAESVALLLSVFGHETTVVNSGFEAVERACATRPDVMIVDLGMPGMDGFEVARRVRAERHLSGIALFALSGYGNSDDRQRSQAAGFDAHLTKPVDSSVLQGLLKKAAESRSHEGPAYQTSR